MRFFQISVLFSFAALLAAAQTPVPVGGGWLRVQQTDPQTGLFTSTFFIQANTGYPERQPTFTITCREPDDMPDVTFNADVILDPQIHDTFNYYRNAIWATIKVDKEKLYKAVWDIAVADSVREARTAIVDRKTAKKLLKASEIKVRFEGHNGQEFIDTFTVTGLDRELFRNACGERLLGR